MSDPSGYTRTVIRPRYALITPDGFVPSVLPGWSKATLFIHVAPVMNGPRFAQMQILMEPGGTGRGNTGPLEHVYYILSGQCTAQVGRRRIKLRAGSYVFISTRTAFRFTNPKGNTRLLVFQKPYQPLANTRKPGVIVGHESEVRGEPFLGNEDARLQVLLPDQPAFDLAVNIFTYQPSATLPFVETHIMEHGLLMLAGQGIYRLDDDHHPVMAGDVIWMASYCPQWFVATGKTPASYIYYKDVNRPPL